MQILLVDDDPGDVLIIEEALQRRFADGELSVAADGVEAMSYLRREGEHARAARPDLILLDLNMPRMGGQEVLTALKSDADLRHIPVIVLTTSAAQEDVLGSYRRHAAAFVTKPVDLDDFTQVVRQIDEFYDRTAVLPPKS